MTTIDLQGYFTDCKTITKKPLLEVAPTTVKYFRRPKNYTTAVTYLQF